MEHLEKTGALGTDPGPYPVAARVLFFSCSCGQPASARISLCMGTLMTDEPGENEALLGRAAGGDKAALAAFWERHRKRLRLMVRLRLDRRLQGRVDPSDVLQEAYI